MAARFSLSLGRGLTYVGLLSRTTTHSRGGCHVETRSPCPRRASGRCTLRFRCVSAAVVVVAVWGLTGCVVPPPPPPDPVGTVTVFTDVSLGQPRDIALGGDGNLWFTSYSGYSIGRVTPTGVVTSFRVPEVPLPNGIAAGLNGDLWFTTGAAFPTHSTRVGRITSNGVITLFSGVGISSPLGITLGPDGNMWFANWGSKSLGSITPDGVVSNFPALRPGTPRPAESPPARTATFGSPVPGVEMGIPWAE